MIHVVKSGDRPGLPTQYRLMTVIPVERDRFILGRKKTVTQYTTLIYKCTYRKHAQRNIYEQRQRNVHAFLTYIENIARKHLKSIVLPRITYHNYYRELTIEIQVPGKLDMGGIKRHHRRLKAIAHVLKNALFSTKVS